MGALCRAWRRVFTVSSFNGFEYMLSRHSTSILEGPQQSPGPVMPTRARLTRRTLGNARFQTWEDWLQHGASPAGVQWHEDPRRRPSRDTQVLPTEHEGSLMDGAKEKLCATEKAAAWASRRQTRPEAGVADDSSCGLPVNPKAIRSGAGRKEDFLCEPELTHTLPHRTYTYTLHPASPPISTAVT